jgi:acyl carrier protein
MSELAGIIKEKIKEIAFKKVNDDDELFKSGVLTSILTVDLATALEEELGISIPFTEITAENFNSVNSIKDYLNSKKN